MNDVSSSFIKPVLYVHIFALSFLNEMVYRNVSGILFSNSLIRERRLVQNLQCQTQISEDHKCKAFSPRKNQNYKYPRR